ncbi:MAG: hypothetical protein U0414_24095 [Polyangiaceae bacterium]
MSKLLVRTLLLAATSTLTGCASRPSSTPVPAGSATSAAVASSSVRPALAPSDDVAELPPAPVASASAEPAPLRPLPDLPDAELFRELASGRRPIAEVVDPVRGVGHVYAGSSPCDQDCPPTDEKLCTPAGDERLLGLFQQAAGALDAAAYGSPMMECAALQCVKQALMEWSPFTTFVFEKKRDSPLRLVSVSELDVAAVPDDIVARDRSTIAPRLKKIAATSCPAR